MKNDGRGDPDFAFGYESESLKYLGFSVEDSTMRAFMVSLNLVNSNCHLRALEENQASVSKNCQRSPEPASSIRIELSKTHAEGQRFPALYVRVFYNSQLVEFCGENKGYCDLNTFVERFGANTILRNDQENLCIAKKVTVSTAPLRLILVITIILVVLWLRHELQTISADPTGKKKSRDN